MLCEMASNLHLHTANLGGEFTFVRGCTGSVIDITFGDEITAGRIRKWKVLDSYSHSDHRYISFELVRQGSERSLTSNRGWSVKKFDGLTFDEMVESKREELISAARSGARAEELVCSLNSLMRVACDASMPKRGGFAHRRPAYWWNDEIADLRRACLASRRRAQRRPSGEEQRLAYRQARKALRQAIKRSKARCWTELCESVSADPWGMPYRIVRQKLRVGTDDHYLNNPANLEAVIAKLFPNHPAIDYTITSNPTEVDGGETFAPFSQEELLGAARRIKLAKAPGPDGVPNAVIKRIAEKYPALLLAVFNACLSEGRFDASWKRQRLVLISKGKQGPPGPSSYRPLCMLDGLGKMLERMILQRLQYRLEDEEDGLSPQQFGFRPGRSTIGAIKLVVNKIKDAWQGSL